MFQKEWEVLVVDDEPDVLAVSKLVMKNFTVYGIPLKIHTLGSAAAAVDLIRTRSDFLPALAVAFIDVVMETADAGLQLCRFIREDCNNHMTQLYVRTGQPGMAPERSVVDRYDINGYFSKVESTENKLYSLVKSGVRQYYWSEFAMANFAFMRDVIEAAGSRAAIAATLQQLLSRAYQERSGDTVASYSTINYTIVLGNEVVASVGWDAKEALETRDRLDQMDGVALTPTGDKYVIDGDHRMFIKVAASPNRSEAYSIATPSFHVPNFVPIITHQNLSALASLWHKAG